jgi:hypothetical protein
MPAIIMFAIIVPVIIMPAVMPAVVVPAVIMLAIIMSATVAPAIVVPAIVMPPLCVRHYALSCVLVAVPSIVVYAAVLTVVAMLPLSELDIVHSLSFIANSLICSTQNLYLSRSVIELIAL